MKALKRIIIALVIVVVLFIGYIFAAIFLSGLPTKGEKIANYASPQKALLVIDIQEDFAGPGSARKSPHGNVDTVINRVNKTIKKAQAKNVKIIYIKQEYEGFIATTLMKVFFNGIGLKDSPGSAIDKRVSILSKNIFTKPIADSFSNPELEKFLIEHQVNELYLTGLDVQYCVHGTARGALNRGYTVNVITDNVLLDKIDKWDELMKQYKEDGIVLIESKDF